MPNEMTLAIIKPDAVRRRLAGEIIHRFELAGFKIVNLRMEYLTRAKAEGFYQIHRDKPFFNELVEFMISGACIPMALEKEDAVEDLRTLIGVTDSRQAACGTVRQNFGTDIQMNAVHASDSTANAKIEIAYFFPDPKA